MNDTYTPARLLDASATGNVEFRTGDAYLLGFDDQSIDVARGLYLRRFTRAADGLVAAIEHVGDLV
jgi:hypothetical protein